MKFRYPLKFNLLLMGYLFFSCATTNYYTGKTLESGQSTLTPAIDNLLIVKDSKVQKKDIVFTPSFGYAKGFPARFEAGVRYYIPYLLEFNIRKQLNPLDFKWFDISANFHTGFLFSGVDEISAPYFKYGATISKEINRVQPYCSYFYTTNFPYEEDEKPTGFNSISFGLAFPWKSALVFPEINYFSSINGDHNYFTFGIGLRTSLNND